MKNLVAMKNVNVNPAKKENMTTPASWTADETKHHPECHDTSGNFAALLARTFKSSLEKVHMITKKVSHKRSPLLGNSTFTRKRFGLLIAIHMAFVKMGLIKTK